MPRVVLAVTLAVAVLAFTVGAAAAQTYPEPIGHVNDFAGILSPSAAADLDAELARFARETSVEIAVVTVHDVGGTTVEDYAVNLFERWGIGRKGVDNGVLLLHARQPDAGGRRWRIEVGYGMEPYLTDSQAGRILDNDVLPDFNAGNVDLAFTRGATAIARRIIDSGYEPGAVRPPSPVPSFIEDNLLVLAILGILSVYVVSYMARTREVALGGIWGGIAGGVLGGLLGPWWPILAGIAGMGLGGFLLDIVLSSAYRSQRRGGRPTGWGSTWGGFRGGGWGGGGGFRGGGGFGGFGGGRSGGGGASR
ncbi:MAG: TPM domain-containing protein [SAR202 cluster bacterium]|nr:TPM domain-containing protein [SAR202 cluster bacterium]